jgi:hypothetical protein
MLWKPAAVRAIPFVFVCLLAGMVAASSTAWAQEDGPVEPASVLAPLGTGFTYQGELQDANGPVTGACDFRFTLFDALTGGTPVGNPQTVPSVSVENGRFFVILNGGGQFGANAFMGNARWLQVEVRCPAGSGSFSALSPRQELTAAPYAVYATKSGTAPWDGLTDIPADIADGDHVGVYTAGSGLVLNGNQFSTNFGGNGIANTVARSDHNHGGQNWIGTAQWGLRVTNFSTALFASGMTGVSSSPTGSGIEGYNFLASGPARGVAGSVGSAQGVGVSGFVSATTGLNAGVRGISNSIGGAGVDGLAAATSGVNYGIFGQSNAVSGRGVSGLAAATTGSNFGVRGQSDSVSGNGVAGYATATAGSNAGVRGESNSASGAGVVGSVLATTGINAGVLGGSNSVSGAGVLGVGAATTGANFGVRGQSNSPSGTGVAGYANASSGANAGIYGTTSSPTGWAGYFDGPVNVNGTLFATTKMFRIDHPLDPENKYLNHASVESSEMKNIYGGNATLDTNGEAIVQLPEWFEALNKDFRYQLTPIGAPGPNLHIAQPIQNNQFKIAGGAAGMVVSWQVTGIRHDPYAEAHPLVVEEEKPAEQIETYLAPEISTFLAPEELGQPEQMGAEQERMQALQQQAQHAEQLHFSAAASQEMGEGE